MKAGKAYISSLGTTGLLIASSLALLLVGGTIVAFDRWPNDEPSGAEVVAVDGSERAKRASQVTAEQRRAARVRAAERRRRAAAQRRRAARVKARARPDDGAHVAPTITDPVISDLPAPDSDGSAGQSGGTAPGAGGAPGSGGGGSDSGSETTRQLGQAVSNVSPQAGGAIGNVGGSLDTAINHAAPSLTP